MGLAYESACGAQKALPVAGRVGQGLSGTGGQPPDNVLGNGPPVDDAGKHLLHVFPEYPVVQVDELPLLGAKGTGDNTPKGGGLYAVAGMPAAGGVPILDTV